MTPAPLVLALVALGASHAPAHARPDPIELPPERFAHGPSLSGATTEIVFSDRATLRAFCNAHVGVPAPGSYYMACYVPNLDTIALPGPEIEPDPDRRIALHAHEWGHARGWRHNPDGRGTLVLRTAVDRRKDNESTRPVLLPPRRRVPDDRHCAQRRTRS